jgi:transposase
MNHPQWALKHKKKGTELRFINGTYYLYAVSSRWNPEKKRSQKITGKLLGKITPAGFIESPKYTLSSSPAISPSVKEYGATFILNQLMEHLVEPLKNAFPLHWKQILSFSFLRTIHQVPLKNAEFYFNQSFLSETYADISMTDKSVSQLLRIIGSNRQSIVSFFKSIYTQADDSHLLIDLTHLISYSDTIEKAKTGYNSHKDFNPQLNLFFIYSDSLNIPVYYRVLPGNIREVRAFKTSLEESGIKNAVIIADKGFYSEDNINQIHSENLRCIIPLRRSNLLIDYRPVKEKSKKAYEGFFEYSGRFVWYYSYVNGQNTIHVFMDESLRQKEEHDYLARIQTHPETHSIEEFHEKEYRFGTLSILTNIKDLASCQIYEMYKTRNNIELMFDTMKNTLQADCSYMQNEEALEGWMFITFIALQCYYAIYQRLLSKKLLSKYSSKDLLLRCAEIKKIKINSNWVLSEITSKTAKLLEKLELPIT